MEDSKCIKAKLILDETGYNSTLKGVNNTIKQTQAAFKEADSQVKAFGETESNLKNVQKALSDQLTIQAKKVEIYKEQLEKSSSKLKENINTRNQLKQSLESAKNALNANTKNTDKNIIAYAKNREELKKLIIEYEKVKNKFGENSDEAQKLSAKIKHLNAAQEKLINLNKEGIETFEKQKSKVEELTEAYNKSEKAVENNARKIENYKTNLSKANTTLNNTKAKMNSINKHILEQGNKWKRASEYCKKASDKWKNFGEGADKVGSSLLKLNAPLIAAGGFALKAGTDFEYGMKQVQAISGGTQEDLEKLSAKAKEMGRTSIFSCSQAAEALKYMGMAGWDTQQMLDGLPGVINAAAASGEDLGQVSDIITDSLSAFGLQAKDSAHFADILAQASNASNTSILGLGESFKYCAAPCGALKYSAEDASIALGLMANQGIKNSQAGTALRTSIVNMVRPTDKMEAAMKKLNISLIDQNGKMKSLREVMLNLRSSFKNLSEDQKASNAATIFGKEALSGMLAIINTSDSDFNKLINAIDNSSGAAQKMADTMNNCTHGQWELLKSQAEELGIKLGRVLLPMANKAMDGISKLMDKFSALSPSMQETIIKTVLFGTATGGIIKSIGGLATGISGIISLISKFSGGVAAASVAAEGLGAATAGIGTASATATGGLTAIVSALGTIAPIALPIIGILGGVGLAAYGIHKVLTKEVVPSVDLFADKTEMIEKKLKNGQTIMESHTKTISAETKKQVQAYIELDKKASKSLTDLYVHSTQIAEENAKELENQYKEMSSKIQEQYKQHCNTEINTLQNLFKNSKDISKDSQDKILRDTENYYAEKEQKELANNEKISAILARAKNEHRELNLTEKQEIAEIQNNMKSEAIEALSKQKEEVGLLQERMKDFNTRITAEQASEIITKAEEQRKGVVDKANEECDETIKMIIHKRDETHTISAEQADKLIKEAKRQRDEVVKKAEEQKKEVVDKMKEQNKDLENQVDTSTGKILNIWDKLKKWWTNWKPESKIFSGRIETVDASGGSGKFSSAQMPGRWTGDDFWQGGLTYVHEKGYELMDLPRGTRIYNHEASQDMVNKAVVNTVESVTNRILQGFKGNSGINVTQNIYAPVPTPSEIARQTRNKLMDLGLTF